jgi:hypothetical protein
MLLQGTIKIIQEAIDSKTASLRAICKRFAEHAIAKTDGGIVDYVIISTEIADALIAAAKETYEVHT